jgi:hypothetical protein
MEFPNAHVKAVKADFVSDDITLTFRVKRNADSQAEAERLALLVGQENDAGRLMFVPNQPGLPFSIPDGVESVTFSTISNGKEETIATVRPNPTHPDDWQPDQADQVSR